MKTLKKLNDSVLMRDQFWAQNNQDGKLTAERMFEGIQKMYSGLSEQHFENYVRNIFGYEGELKEFTLDEVEFKMKHHPFYLYDWQKNDDFVIKLFSPKDQSE